MGHGESNRVESDGFCHAFTMPSKPFTCRDGRSLMTKARTSENQILYIVSQALLKDLDGCVQDSDADNGSNRACQ